MIKFNFHKGLWIIRAFSKGKMGHISIQIESYIYEALPNKGVIKTSIYEWDGYEDLIESITITTSHLKRDELIIFLDKQVGKKYDMIGIFSFVWPFIPVVRGFWYCSELGKVALLKILGLNTEIYSHKESPQSLYELTKITCSRE